VTIALLDRGYSAEEIQKIWGGNFVRVFRETGRLASVQRARDSYIRIVPLKRR